MKCVFFTHQQFNVEKIHIPKQSLVIDQIIYATNSDEINIKINEIIDNVYIELNKDNISGIPFKVPMPIFILMARKLDYNGNIFEDETFNTDYKTPFNYGSQIITPQVIEIDKRKQGVLAIVDFLTKFFKSGIGDEPKDENKYNESVLITYKFKGNMRIIIYFPYLTANYKYVTNFTDIANSSKFFYTLIAKKTFLNFERTTTLNFDELRKKFKAPIFSDQAINNILTILRQQEKKKYGFYDDLYKLCEDGGCISDTGEDFARLLPDYIKDDEGKNNENAIKFSPFLPTKCLAQTDGYINNIKKATKTNLDLPELLKKYAMKDIKEGLERYLRESIIMIKSPNQNVNPDELDNFKSPIDLIINIINNKIKDNYSIDLNDGDKPNHYSKEYSQNIIKELSILKKYYPGIPEIIMSLYLYNETLKPDKIAYMPWGRTIVSNRNVLSVGELLPVNTKLYSFNNQYFLTVTSNGIIFVADNKKGNLLYFINRQSFNKVNGMTFELNGIMIEYMNIDNNIKSANISILNGIKTLIGDCDECNEGPYNLILENNGNISIYSNSFFNATNNGLKTFIKKEFDIINNMQSSSEKNTIYNINDPKFTETINYKIADIKEEEDYLFCADIQEECKK